MPKNGVLDIEVECVTRGQGLSSQYTGQLFAEILSLIDYGGKEISPFFMGQRSGQNWIEEQPKLPRQTHFSPGLYGNLGSPINGW